MRHNQYQDEERLRQHKLKYPVPGSLSPLEEYNKMWDDHWREQNIIIALWWIFIIAVFTFCYYFD